MQTDREERAMTATTDTTAAGCPDCGAPAGAPCRPEAYGVTCAEAYGALDEERREEAAAALARTTADVAADIEVALRVHDRRAHRTRVMAVEWTYPAEDGAPVLLIGGREAGDSEEVQEVGRALEVLTRAAAATLRDPDCPWPDPRDPDALRPWS
jgi:hypothetical protein